MIQCLPSLHQITRSTMWRSFLHQNIRWQCLTTIPSYPHTEITFPKTSTHKGAYSYRHQTYLTKEDIECSSAHHSSEVEYCLCVFHPMCGRIGHSCFIIIPFVICPYPLLETALIYTIVMPWQCDFITLTKLLLMTLYHLETYCLYIHQSFTSSSCNSLQLQTNNCIPGFLLSTAP